ncbi:hypothetical protein E2C01_002188 [Portunus trituberculatus]|uniref:Uncharacterized protein n=1 Tax=Portunus trituberculatus TaxID=210409 RepID=A0A5B7CPW3_PORTR|nr:hypothetical protein [Portunus trituberculatus]
MSLRLTTLPPPPPPNPPLLPPIPPPSHIHALTHSLLHIATLRSRPAVYNLNFPAHHHLSRFSLR